MRRDKQIDQFNELNPILIIDSAEGIASNNSDDAVPTAAAVKSYVDANGGISEVADDTSPTLGGNLDVGAFNLTNMRQMTFAGTAGQNNIIMPDNIDGDALAFKDSGGGATLMRFKTANGFEEITMYSNVQMQSNLSFDTGSAVNQILDEDDMASDSESSLATQQSIKAYVDARKIETISVANFEDPNRYSTNTSGTGVLTWNSGEGVAISCGATSGGTAQVYWSFDWYYQPYSNNPTASFRIGLNTVTNDFTAFFVLGYVDNGDLTQDHAGFKIVRTGGVISLYASQANGSANTVSSALTTLVTSDALELIIHVNGTTSIDYYYRKNGGALSSVTTLSTNVPSGFSSGNITLGIHADASNVGTNGQIYVASASHRR